MKKTVLAELKRKTALWISAVTGETVTEKEIRIPAREAAMSCPAFVRMPERLEKVIQLLKTHPDKNVFVSRLWEKNGWILMDPVPDFYTEVLNRFSNSPIPYPEEGSYCYHRMRMLTRYPESDCPDDPDVQRAILLCLVYEDEPTKAHLEQAEEALLKMAYAKKPQERQPLLMKCGNVARAAIQLLYRTEE